MENQLLNCYLKYQKDRNKSVVKAIRKLPMYILILLILALLCLVATLVSVFVPGMGKWFYVFTLAEAIISFVLYLVQERWEVKYSRERYTNYKQYARNLYKWLLEYSITTKEEIELIKSRLTDDLERQDELKRQQNERADKWMQTLVVPLVLAIITSFISNQPNIENAIGITVALLAIFGFVYAFIWIIRSVAGILNNRKRNNIKCFIDDLQSVIDVMFVFITKDSSK